MQHNNKNNPASLKTAFNGFIVSDKNLIVNQYFHQ